MKKLALLVCLCTAITLTGCFETTVEITLQEDGSGTVSNTTDMSKMIAMGKQMGNAGEMEKAEDQVMDTSFSLAAGADSIPNLSPEELEIARQGTASFNMNMKEDKFLTSVSFPFSNPEGIALRNRLSSKILNETIKSQLGGSDMPGLEEMGNPSSFDDYYDLVFSKGKISRSLNKEKYAKVADDKYLSSLKEFAGMGLAMSSIYIINLPHPAKNVKGESAVLSDDKMKVTIKAGIDEFFDAPGKLEFKIEY